MPASFRFLEFFRFFPFFSAQTWNLKNYQIIKFFVGILVQTKASKSHFEINLPLLGVPKTPQTFQVFLLFTTWSPTDPADLWNVYIFVVYRVSQTPQTFQMSSFYYLESHRPDRPSIRLILLVLTWSPTNPKDL